MLSLFYSSFFLLLLSKYWEIFMMTLVLLFFFSMTNFMGMKFYLSKDLFFYSNSLSFLLVLLTIFLVYLCYLSTLDKKTDSMHILTVFLLMLILILVFKVSNLLHFYILFEMSLIPTLYLIVSWGYQPERLQAGNYMMIYTVFASLPLLVIILFYMKEHQTVDIFYMKNINSLMTSPFFIMLLLTAFLIKLPMYGFHLWLPKAHVEAPLAGSMLLAGILLKLGGYGLCLMYMIFNIMNYPTLYFLISLSIWGSMLATFMCMQQCDLKAMVAYSSVAHMGVLVACILLSTCWGESSFKLIMFSHGFISPGMFLLAMMSYKLSNSRSLYYIKGLLSVNPILCLFWFLFCFCNMAAPPSLNFFGEMFMIPVIMNMSFYNYFVIGILMFMSVLFSVYMYMSVNHGVLSQLIKPSYEIKSSDILSLMIHLLMILLIFKLDVFI
uniref:NADH-ubiquinone oxidoreductase chain 4 n=1 Tax=Succineidae gen. n. sp. z RM-2021 TaxID=2871687 RepID=A0A977XSL8_9EUPU|nr:NADH dehydrogenase subunit 4 [Succineidae gen. n. sp. z RM-2021]